MSNIIINKVITCVVCGKDSVNSTIYRDPVPGKPKLFEVGILLNCKHKQISYFSTDFLEKRREKLQRVKDSYQKEFDRVQKLGVGL